MHDGRGSNAIMYLTQPGYYLFLDVDNKAARETAPIDDDLQRTYPGLINHEGCAYDNAHPRPTIWPILEVR